MLSILTLFCGTLSQVSNVSFYATEFCIDYLYQSLGNYLIYSLIFEISITYTDDK